MGEKKEARKGNETLRGAKKEERVLKRKWKRKGEKK